VTSPARWRLLRDAPDDGAWNMAVDEALLDSHLEGRPVWPVTLRLYGWTPATLSLGKGQAADRVCDLSWLRARGIDLVRRPTGGQAVLHDDERTYAVAGRVRRAPFAGGVLETYRSISRALVDGLASLGVPAKASAGPAPRPAGAACFALTSAHEIEAGGRKLVGSAQLRRRDAFLQHGSILLHADARLLARATATDVTTITLTDLARLLGRRPRAEALDEAIVGAFESVFSVRLEEAALDGWERERATRLYTWKYLSSAWTIGGRAGARERHWGPPLSAARE
jgi:lipoate-protein ligase A